MLPITLKCVCGSELEIIPKRLQDVADVIKANDWRRLHKSSVGRQGVIAALCPKCKLHEEQISIINQRLCQSC